MKQIVDFGAVKIQIASPQRILEWSYGEVKKPETINYRTLKPEKDGLFCERIFGPTKDWECYCGKYKRIRYKGIKCDKCGVEVTQARVRRERMGHLKLAAPVAHVWFFKGAPSKLSLLLDISPRNLSSIMYFSQYIVLKVDEAHRDEILNNLVEESQMTQDQLKEEAKDQIEKIKVDLSESIEQLTEKVKSKEILEIKSEELRLKAKQQIAGIKENLETELSQTEEVYKTVREMVKRIKKGTILSEDEYLKLDEYNAVDHLEVGMGAESLLRLVDEIDLAELSQNLQEEIREATGPRAVKLRKRLRVVEGFRRANIKPSWMFLSTLPVMPPDLRPMVQLSGGRFATSDLNDLYRRVINRNNRLKHLIDLGAPEIILRNEKRMLQEAVDSLIDSTRVRRTRRSTQRQLRSLSEMLRGKQGRFRQNLLGKRVDYSGRSVIVVGPELKLNQCGLPKDMALEMFKPYVLRELIKQGLAPNVKSAKHALERRSPEVYDILDQVIHNHPVLLNRAPTLHKLGIQAFYPQLIEGNAIRLHPCVCSGYNADFDGDQMAVHVPLTEESQEEARSLMMPLQNFLKPADGSPITVPNKEMAMGIYYQTSVDERIEKSPSIFADKDEAIHAYETERVQLRQLIRVRLPYGEGGKLVLLETTVGRILFNEILPEYMRYLNDAVNAGKIKELITVSIKHEGSADTARLIDAIKDMGFEAATFSGLSVSVTDCKMIPEKDSIIESANKRAEVVQDNYNQGLITEDEKRRLMFEVWMETTDTVAEKTWESYSEENAVKIMINSGGTRASKDQVKQLAAMRGLVVDPLGKIVEMPTKSNFREGLTIFEYVTSARGSRKGLTDSALKTADAGYLTRRLVDVAHDMIIRMQDCGTEEGREMVRETSREKTYADRITGRFALKDVVDSQGNVLVTAGALIEEDEVKKIMASDAKSVWVRSPLTCEAPAGLCSKCYGWDFSNKKVVELGLPAGVVAAQSIGEPGTQLTMRVKHSGGIVGLDVTQGLPRVEELFEARIPKAQAPMSDISGQVSIEDTGAGYMIRVTSTSKPVEEREYQVPMGAQLLVKEGDLIHAGAQLVEGALDVKEVLTLRGLRAAQDYLLKEIQKVYESQGISINDKHFEVIIRRMSDKVRIENNGDTHLLSGEIIDRIKLREINQQILAEGGEPATAQVMIGGISRVSLYTDSWLSAASFQHTTSVLADAASSGAEDPLVGLKENVIIGRLIPTNEERASIEYMNA